MEMKSLIESMFQEKLSESLYEAMSSWRVELPDGVKTVKASSEKDAINKAMANMAGFAKRDLKSKIAFGKVKIKAVKEEVELASMREAKDDYTINHKTFSSAVQHAMMQAEKQGYEIDSDEWDDKVATGPRKPSAGKTNKYTIALMKNGKETRRNLQMQVYYDEGRYELNMYIS
jgi:ribosomal protein L20A (L18A)